MSFTLKNEKYHLKNETKNIQIKVSVSLLF